jgi:hypothetical protein
MTLPYLKITYQNTDYKTFVDFWSKYYIISPKDNLYTDRINKSKFTKIDIEKLFEWKNGMKINGHKQKEISIEKITSRLNQINKLKADFDIMYFNRYFSNIAAIWQIFLLHIIKPKKFPIFDQHVYRAHTFLLDKKIIEIPNIQLSKLKYYHNNYLPFFDKIKSEITNLRQIDLALWTFGKFLKTDYAKKLVK